MKTLKTAHILTLALVVLSGVAVLIYWSTPATAVPVCPPTFNVHTTGQADICGPEDDVNLDGVVCGKVVGPQNHIVCIDNRFPSGLPLP